MNIFVLNSGRCGSSTFIKACQHISNYTSAHESLASHIGDLRLTYPDQHIEADNRLSWLLGRLDEQYGDKAFYVHLTRNRKDTAESFRRRYNLGIMKAYREGILMGGRNEHTTSDIALDYIDTVEANITLFLKDKTQTAKISLDSAKTDFHRFWQAINATGDLDKALREWDTRYNASET